MSQHDPIVRELALREGRATPVDGMEELRAYLAAHPETRCLDALLLDLCGIARGKRYPIRDAEKLFAGGMQIPLSLYLLDVTGDCLDPSGRGFSDGDPDGTVVPVPGRLVPVPWAEEPTAQVLLSLRPEGEGPEGERDVDPRNALRRVCARFAERDLTPVVAVELEFYLLDRERDALGRPQPPRSPLTGRPVSSTQVYGMNDVEAFGAFLRDVEAAARIQNVPVATTSSEFAPGQFEINLHHVADAVRAADDAALLRRIVIAIAARHGFAATFLSKPFLERAGSGMHVHVSLCDGSGRNLFDETTLAAAEGAPAGPNLRRAVGGLLATMPEAMAIFAPNLNAFRRYAPNLYVPVTRSWGVNNRSVACRVPTGPASARRIEHRVAGADANPYLVLAAVLAGIHHGLTVACDPGPPARGNAGAASDPDLPLAIDAALDALAGARILPDYLGAEYLALYIAAKRAELAKFRRHISPLEYEWYL